MNFTFTLCETYGFRWSLLHSPAGPPERDPSLALRMTARRAPSLHFDSSAGIGKLFLDAFNFVFADGHVQFLNASMDHTIYTALSTRAGGEPVGDF